MSERIGVMLKRLKKIENRERNAIRRGSTCQAVGWGMLANSTWTEILKIAEATNSTEELPGPMGPLARSAPFGQYKEDN